MRTLVPHSMPSSQSDLSIIALGLLSVVVGVDDVGMGTGTGMRFVLGPEPDGFRLISGGVAGKSPPVPLPLSMIPLPPPVPEPVPEPAPPLFVPVLPLLLLVVVVALPSRGLKALHPRASQAVPPDVTRSVVTLTSLLTAWSPVPACKQEGGDGGGDGDGGVREYERRTDRKC